MKHLLTAWGLTLLILATPQAVAASGTFGKGALGCTSEELFDEFSAAWARRDDEHVGALLDRGGGCHLLAGRRYLVVHRGRSRSKVRVYLTDRSMLYWTASENIADAR